MSENKCVIENLIFSLYNKYIGVMKMKVRLYKPVDLEDVLELFYNSVHEVCREDYTQEQLDAWAPRVPDVLRWKSSLNRNHTIVAEDNGKIVGFGDIGETGYLDRLYVDSMYLHQGVASLILYKLEKYALTKGVRFMNTAASITAKSFFEKRGYVVLEEQIVERRGVRMRRYLMEKKL